MSAPRELVHFLLLTQAEQAAAIRRLAAAGWSEYGIAAATRLSVEMVRRVLTEENPGDEHV
jgi:hypothetical protein